MRARREREFELLRQKYGAVEQGTDLDWLIIKAFTLPPGWARARTELLVIVPPGYPMTAPDNFYVETGLRLAAGSPPQNYSEPVMCQGRHWGLFSFHVESGWVPSADLLAGHNLLTFMINVESRFAELS